MQNLTPDQSKALNTILSWYKNGLKKIPFLTLGGYAGTGKTTLISILRKEIHKHDKTLKIAFITYTAKGSLVLREKLVENDAIYKQDFVGTIHSLIYSPITNKNEEIVGWEVKDEIKHDIIIIDEASMVDEKIWQDLCSFKLPVIAVGDHGQLPPINGNFNLMQKPMIKLETIHRQAKDNPVINLSIMARETGRIPPGDFGKFVKKISTQSEDFGYFVDELLEDLNDETILLCGYNSTRVKLNNHIRSKKLFEGTEPEIGDKLICLRNNHTKNVFNGMTGKIESIQESDKDWYYADILMDTQQMTFSGLIYKKQFNAIEPINFSKGRKQTIKGDLFDFGYAITVHKAQGSEADKVILFEERFKQMTDEDWKRWLYTAVTRAKKELYIIGD